MIGLPLRFAIRNLRRHGRRALIIGLGIAVVSWVTSGRFGASAGQGGLGIGL